MISKNPYNRNYFNWQKPIGEFGGWANLDKFKDYLDENYKVVDFGCGGGNLLKNIKCKDKIGVEINREARKFATKIGVKTVDETSKIKNLWADLIISNNALEHTKNPLRELKMLYKKLKKGGTAVFIVPCESISYNYEKNDINHHLYSWSPMCIGNLFTEAGFTLISSRPYRHKWPPFYQTIAKICGRTLFNIICRINGLLSRDWHQVRVIAQK